MTGNFQHRGSQWQMVIKIEVHGYEKWLTTEWQQRHLAQNDPTKSTTQLIISSPEFHPDTDIHIFYEWAVLNDALYRRVPIEKRFGLLLESSANREVSAKSISHINQYAPFLLIILVFLPVIPIIILILMECLGHIMSMI